MSISAQIKKWGILVLKIAVSLFCLWYVFTKIDWTTSWQTIRHSNLLWFAGAIFFIIASKFVAAYRLNIYFKNIGTILHRKVNIKLYWLGMYYNIFLPGGVGGDAYKVIMLNRTYNHPAKLLTAAVLLDRASGVAAIGILTALYYYGIFGNSNYSCYLLASVIPGLLIYYFIVRKFFPSFLRSFWSTLWLGLAVQLTQVFAIYCMMYSFGIPRHHTEYILIFLLSSLIAVLPFTIGGLGAREIVFVWGSTQFGLNQSQSVAISIIFYLISVSISLPGIYWVYNDPLPKAVVTADA